MILLAVFLAFVKLSSSVNIDPTGTNVNLNRGLGLGAYHQLADDSQGFQHQSAHAIAYLMPMGLFDQSAALVALSQGSLPEQALLANHQSGDASYVNDKALSNQGASLDDKEEESYGSTGAGVGALNLDHSSPAAARHYSGHAIDSYSHVGSGSSDWVPIRNPHFYH